MTEKIEKAILGALKSAAHAHPEINYSGMNGSIAKRIAGEVAKEINKMDGALALMQLALETAGENETELHVIFNKGVIQSLLFAVKEARMN